MVSAVGHPDLSDGPRLPRPVLLNARAATRPTITGVERWTAEVVTRLRALDPGRYRIVVPRARVRSRALGQSWEQVGLPLAAWRAGAALVLSPANLAPLAWPRNVLVMHDAAVLGGPAAYSRRSPVWYRGVWLVYADHVLAV
ncbi:MAG: hypothetical protein ACR2NR_18975, partial [Solirubrobacteraceae bacterium]